MLVLAEIETRDGSLGICSALWQEENEEKHAFCQEERFLVVTCLVILHFSSAAETWFCLAFGRGKCGVEGFTYTAD